MKNLSSLLERFSKSLNKDSLLKENIINIIKTNTKASISQENISLKGGILEIKTTPVIKSEIKLKEEEIINSLKGVSRIIYK